MARIDFLRDEFTKVRSGIDAIEAAPAGANGDLSEEQVEQSAALFARAEELRVELEPLVARQRSIDATAGILAGLGVTQRPGPAAAAVPADVSPVEYLASYVRAMAHEHSGYTLDDHQARFRTVATQTTADHTGLLPTPILQPIINQIDANRYVIPTFTQRPMPASGTTFQRPRITQHVNVAEQAAQLDELTSQKLTTTAADVSKRTWGGSLQISRQDQDWTDPAVLSIVIDDFTNIYSKVTDAAAASSLVSAAAATVAWTATSLGTVMTSIANAAASVYAAASVMPDSMWVSLDEGLSLGTLTTPDGHLAFPEIGVGRLNVTDAGLGMSGPLGLRLFVCPNLAVDTRIIGLRGAAEWYEDRKGFLEVTFPSALKTELAYFGYTAAYFQPNSFIKLV